MANSTIFSGGSRYSQDFQSVIDRRVAIASLPLNQMSTQKARLDAEATVLSGLDTKFSSLTSALKGLSTALADRTPKAAVSNTAIARVRTTERASESQYDLQVTSLGSHTSLVSKASLTTVTDPSTQNISGAGSFTLEVDGVSHTITPTATTLDGLVSSINSSSTAGVRAAVVNLGSTSSPDYRLSLQSARLGNVAVSLQDGGEMLDSVTTGSEATYKINGISTVVSSDSRTVTLSPGVTADLLAEGSTTISLARSTEAIATSLGNFVANFNNAFDELQKQRGESAGILSGHSIVSTLEGTLRSLAGANGEGSIASLQELGISYNAESRLVFDSAVFREAIQQDREGVLSFLGDEQEGFMGGALRTLNGLQDTASGALATTKSTLQEGIARQSKLIAENERRIDLLRESLTAQISASDALIASLEQQVNYMTSLFESMQAQNR